MYRNCSHHVLQSASCLRWDAQLLVDCGVSAVGRLPAFCFVRREPGVTGDAAEEGQRIVLFTPGFLRPACSESVNLPVCLP